MSVIKSVDLENLGYLYHMARAAWQMNQIENV